MDQRTTRVSTIFSRLLQRCIVEEDLAGGRELHKKIIRSGLESDAYLGSYLIRMFSFCGSLSEANHVFNNLPKPNVYTWSSIISAHAKYGLDKEAISLFHQMQASNVQPNGHVCVAVLKACASSLALGQGKLTHAYVINNGLDYILHIGNTLVDMYAKCGNLEDAHAVFIQLPGRDLVTWNAMIAAYAQLGHGRDALCVFQQMQEQGMEPDRVTLVCCLKACSTIAALVDQGKLIHTYVVECEFESDEIVSSTLIDMYAKCRSLKDSRNVFDKLLERNVVAWSAMIAGYAENGHSYEAFQLFELMLQEGVKPNRVTFICTLKALSSIAGLEQSKLVHHLIINTGLETDVMVASTLVDMYSKCESLEEARMVFDRLQIRNLVTWSAMIAGYAKYGHGQEALHLFQQMQQDGMEPDPVFFVCMLKACSSTSALDMGRSVHAKAIERGLEQDAVIGNSLIDMYSKCGSNDDACKVFNRLPNCDVVAWSTMISGFAQCGNHELALKYYDDMQDTGLKPNDATFVSLLSVCSHVGLLNKGCHHFKSMREDYDLSPKIEHYICMVGLLGRTGSLYEAEDLLHTMPFERNLVGWTSLLGHCRTRSDVILGKQCFDHAISLDSTGGASYVLMSNFYARSGMVADAQKIEQLRKSTSAWKKPGKALIEVNKMVHDFIVGDESHPRSKDILTKLQEISVRMEELVFMPGWNSVPSAIFGEDKKYAVCRHCERLAIAFGLISTPSGTTLRISKNLRVCIDCHNATKIISYIEKREIIIADACRIHHFKDVSRYLLTA